MATNNEDYKGRIALVTGVGRKEGIGIEIARQLAQKGFTVLATGRDLKRTTELASVLQAEKLDVRPKLLDVTSDESVAKLVAEVKKEFGHLDVLVNNAGGNYDFMFKTLEVELSYVRDTLEMNVLGAWRVAKAFLPLLRESKHPRIVNVSSEHGSFGGSDGMSKREDAVAAYGVSKAALNAFTMKWGIALQGSGIIINSACPGLTATYPGMEHMPGVRTVPVGAASIVWAATIPDGGPSGGFFRDGKPLPW